MRKRKKKKWILTKNLSQITSKISMETIRTCSIKRKEVSKTGKALSTRRKRKNERRMNLSLNVVCSLPAVTEMLTTMSSSQFTTTVWYTMADL